jgi:hypothetical protein
MGTSGKREIPAPFMVGLTVEVIVPSGEYSSGLTYVAKLDGYMKSVRSEQYYLKLHGYPEEVAFPDGATIEAYKQSQMTVVNRPSMAQPF